MASKTLKLSIVIPVYNEEAFLPACLDAIYDQTSHPYEVIVVDNNSSDKTVEMAKKYSSVKIVKEKRQGVIFARTTGYDLASGDIIGRIDADTLLPANWSEQVVDYFSTHKVDAITGPVFMYDMPFKKIVASVDDLMRKRVYRYGKLRNSAFLSGPNMAFTKKSWLTVRDKLCEEPMIHEDIDLAIHLAKNKYALAYVGDLKASISSRRYNDSFKAFWHYMAMFKYTYQKHRLHGLHVMAGSYVYWFGYVLVHPTRKFWRVFARSLPVTDEQRKNPN